MDDDAPSGLATNYTYSMDLSQTRSVDGSVLISDYEAVVREAFATWSSVAAIDFAEVSSGSGSGHIDVQTTSEFPNGITPDNAPSWGTQYGIVGFGGGTPTIAWQDAAEIWHPYGDGALSYLLVAMHEIGHAIGLPHDMDGMQLMNPSVGPPGLFQGDIDAVVARFGAREWTDAGEYVFLKWVQVAQTVHAKGGDDNIVATALDDVIHSGAGDDTVDAGAGDDQVYDTLGENTIAAGDNDDLVIGGSGKTDAAGGTGNDIIIGGKGDDALHGGSGDDTIRGDAQSSFFYGDDVITAGSGTDFLEGGGGSDRFAFLPNEGTNTIAQLSLSGTDPDGTSATGADFETGVDQIDVSAFDFDSREEAFGFVTLNHNGNAEFSHDGTRIVFYDLDLSQVSANDFLV